MAEARAISDRFSDRERRRKWAAGCVGVVIVGLVALAASPALAASSQYFNGNTANGSVRTSSTMTVKGGSVSWADGHLPNVPDNNRFVLHVQTQSGTAAYASATSNAGPAVLSHPAQSNKQSACWWTYPSSPNTHAISCSVTY